MYVCICIVDHGLYHPVGNGDIPPVYGEIGEWFIVLPPVQLYLSIDWFKGKFSGKPYN